jgi:hypothetical protein
MNSNIDEYGNIGRLSVAHYKPTVTGAGATSNNLASATTVMYPTGPVKVKTLPVLASKVLVSECPRALVVLTGNLPSVEYSTVVLLLTIPLPVPIMNGGQSLRIAIGMLLFTR